ncbi:alpha/beta fold hydrolase [Phytohabitans houttuyneae]|uniref:Arylesterase n=1 Tax=Phytohabitans houttuyneae TaxID=1076126 RepID=A0A6V8KHE1_9ACTN|nr:alpha/beta hydrolase [Phytohabitans houttuyneae]GFJ81416.1 arylesterase [Phytohabitans houttuyneae]
MPTVVTGDGTGLRCEDRGEGRPVVFLNNAMMSSAMWDFQVPVLVDRGYRCVTYDRRGCGRSGRPGGGYDYDTLADDLAALVERLDLREVTLVGGAMGAGEAVRYLTRHGDARVRQLVLVSPVTPFLMRTQDNPDGVDLDFFEGDIARMKADRAGWLASLTGPFFGGAGATPDRLFIPPEVARGLVELALTCSPQAAVELYRTMAITDLRADTEKVTVPTLIIHGAADLAAPLDLCGRRTAQLIAGSRLVIYDSAAHGLFATHPGRLNEDLLSFLAS